MAPVQKSIYLIKNSIPVGFRSFKAETQSFILFVSIRPNGCKIAGHERCHPLCPGKPSSASSAVRSAPAAVQLVRLGHYRPTARISVRLTA